MDEDDELVAIPTGQTFRLTRRGYDPAEVQSFAYAVADELTELRERNNALTQQLAEREARHAANTTRQAPINEAVVASFLGDESLRIMTSVRVSSEETRERAQNAAQTMHLEAEESSAVTRHQIEEYAGRVRREAEEASRRSRLESDDYVDLVRTEADARAAAIRCDADSYVAQIFEACERDNERLGTNARVKADSMLAETRTESADAIVQLNGRRRKAAEDVEQFLSHRRVVLDSLERLRQHTAEAVAEMGDEVSTAVLSGDRR